VPDDTAHDDGLFGERVAATYDSSTDEEFSAAEIAATIDVLAELAGDGPALELAIGTGRVALPLAARGVTVAGIDLSRAMVARLRAKPGGTDLDVAIGDMATTRVAGEFSLVYLIFNTIGNVVTQDAQVQCFENAARHLRPGGRFLIEVGVPELQNLPVGQTIIPFRAAPDGLSFDVYDVVTQRATSQHYVFTPDGRVQSFPLAYRYVWPSELDLMARIAGLRPEHRWANWQREPFTATSRSHVSVWVKA
jgi:SAM-dependent methyltransferase